MAHLLVHIGRCVELHDSCTLLTVLTQLSQIQPSPVPSLTHLYTLQKTPPCSPGNSQTQTAPPGPQREREGCVLPGPPTSGIRHQWQIHSHGNEMIQMGWDSTLYVAPAPPWLFPAASCSGALCCSDILLIHCSSTFWQQHTHRQSTIHHTSTHGKRYTHRREGSMSLLQFITHPWTGGLNSFWLKVK